MVDYESGPPDEEAQVTGAGDSPPVTGNRPAENARQAKPSDGVDDEWFFQEGATDFLGLEHDIQDTELDETGFRLPEAMRQSAAPAGPNPPSIVAPQSAAPQEAEVVNLDAEAGEEQQEDSASWLLSLDDNRAGGDGDDPLLDDPEREEAELQPVETLDASWCEPDRTSGLRRAAVGGIAAVVVGALGFTIFKAYTVPKQGTGSSSNELVDPGGAMTQNTPLSLPGQPNAQQPQADPGATTRTPVTDTPEQGPGGSVAGADPSGAPDGASPGATDPVAATTPTPGAGDMREVGSKLTEGLGAAAALFNGLAGVEPADPTTTAFDPTPAGTEPVATTTGPETLENVPGRNFRPDTVVELPPLEGIRLAGQGDLHKIWAGDAVPMEAIATQDKLLTPYVGRVRAVLRSGEVFEGNLYAVGREQVWLDSKLGRMALEERLLERIDVLGSDGAGVELGAAGSQDLAGLQRVLVRTPGGVFYGKVVAETEKTVTLITDGGTRVTLESRDIEPASDTRAVVVKSVAGVQVPKPEPREEK